MTEELASGEMLKSEKIKRILRERTVKLAAPKKEANHTGDSLEVLQFKLINGTYAFESKFVRELCKLKEITPLPTAPAHIAGLINVRRKIMPVLDLPVLFGFTSQNAQAGKTLIILELEGISFAVATDEIIGIGIIDLSTIDFSLSNFTERDEVYLKGISLSGVAIIDGNKLINNSKITVDDSGE